MRPLRIPNPSDAISRLPKEALCQTVFVEIALNLIFKPLCKIDDFPILYGKLDFRFYKSFPRYFSTLPSNSFDTKPHVLM